MSAARPENIVCQEVRRRTDIGSQLQSYTSIHLSSLIAG